MSHLAVLEKDLDAIERRVKVCLEYWAENKAKALLLRREVNRLRVEIAMRELFG